MLSAPAVARWATHSQAILLSGVAPWPSTVVLGRCGSGTQGLGELLQQNWQPGAAAESRDGDELANGLLVPWWSIGQGGARTQ